MRTLVARLQKEHEVKVIRKEVRDICMEVRKICMAVIKINHQYVKMKLKISTREGVPSMLKKIIESKTKKMIEDVINNLIYFRVRPCL